jgi:hypothetical protein
MSIRIKKYKKLLMEVKFLRSELEYQEAVLSDAHLEFEKKYREWCAKNNVDLDVANKENSKRVEKIFESSGRKLTTIEKKPEKKEEKKMNKLYRQLAKESHPDKNEGDDKLFKTINEAYENGDWSILLEEALKMGIEPNNISEMMPLLKEEMLKLREKINMNNAMYSWKYYECEENEECQERIIKNFLKHLFKLEL